MIHLHPKSDTTFGISQNARTLNGPQKRWIMQRLLAFNIFCRTNIEKKI